MPPSSFPTSKLWPLKRASDYSRTYNQLRKDLRVKYPHCALAAAFFALTLAGPSQNVIGKNCVVLISTPESKARIEKLADSVVELRARANIGREQLPIAVLDLGNPAHAKGIAQLGFKPEDLPLATTGQVDGGGLPISANLHRPPLSLPNNMISYYLLAEWTRREKNPPRLPAYPYPPAPPDGPAAKASTNPIDGSEMLSVPGGKFWRGCCDGELDELPPTAVAVKPFAIGKREVTVGQFEKFVAATGYQTKAEETGFGWCWSDGQWDKVEGANWRNPKGRGQAAGPDSAVTQVTKDDAQAYCDWAKARLPSEDEWEKAARGTAGRRYPWGEQWQEKGRSNLASPYGCLAMGGGVREWTSSPFRVYHPDIVLKEPRSGRLVVRGGSDSDGARESRTTYRFTALPDSRSDQMGFRIVSEGNQKLGAI
jgi:sulfatase modifying factor 1